MVKATDFSDNLLASSHAGSNPADYVTGNVVFKHRSRLLAEYPDENKKAQPETTYYEEIRILSWRTVAFAHRDDTANECSFCPL